MAKAREGVGLRHAFHSGPPGPGMEISPFEFGHPEVASVEQLLDLFGMIAATMRSANASVRP